jgi:hypothetical protein
VEGNLVANQPLAILVHSKRLVEQRPILGHKLRRDGECRQVVDTVKVDGRVSRLFRVHGNAVPNALEDPIGERLEEAATSYTGTLSFFILFYKLDYYFLFKKKNSHWSLYLQLGSLFEQQSDYALNVTPISVNPL